MQPLFPLSTATSQAPAAKKSSLANFAEADILAIGEAPLKGLSSISSQLLASVKATDTAEFGKGLNGLVIVAKGLDPSALSKGGVLGRLKGFLSNAKERMVANYASVEAQIDSLMVALDTKAALHTKRIADMDTMYLENMGYHEQLEKSVAYGESVVLKLRSDLDEQATELAADSFGAQKIADQQRIIARVEKRISDLQRAMLLSKQAAPGIRLTQENARDIVQKFGDIKAVTLPAWRNAFSLYVLQLEQADAVSLTTAIDDLTDSALKTSADLLRQNSADIARSRQRSVVSIETLEHVQSQLLGSVADIQKIEKEGAVQRASESARIHAMELELKNSLVA